MEPDRWQRVNAIFEQALEREGDARLAFVRDACSGDAELQSRQQSVVTLVLGVLGVCLVHSSLRDGQIPLRWSTERMSAADPNFWFYAGCFYALALVMVVLGAVYLTPAGSHLPRIDTDDHASSVVQTGLVLVSVGALGLVLKGVLPGIYF